MLKTGVSVGRNDLNLEEHFLVGYHGQTVKNYKPIKKTIQNNVSESISIIEEKNCS